MRKIPKSQLKKIRSRVKENAKHLTYLESMKRQYIDLIIDDKEIPNDLMKQVNEYRECYASLVFKDGEYQGEKGLYAAVRKGNAYALEYAVSFIEVRPYFFRSGYMYVRLLRYLNNAPLRESQRERYLVVKTKYQALLRKYPEKRGW